MVILFTVDYDIIKNINLYTKYTLSDDSNTVVALLDNTVINVNQNIYESNASIAIGELYNKVVVVALIQI